MKTLVKNGIAMQWAACRPLTKLERGLFYFLFLGVLPAFGVLVECRTAFLDRRMGDLDCFLRAAWAMRTGADPYAVTSDNDWHYNYPPLYAILMMPLADPPAGQDATGYMPYPISAALCFLGSVLLLGAGVHHLAGSIEQTSTDPALRAQPRFCLRWWTLRLWPVLVCLCPIGHTLARGQVNLIVLAILCAALAGWLRGQNFRAGAWLALAICIKVIPAYLLVYPLWKRDGRGLLGCGVGLLAGLVVIPLLACGPARTQAHYETYANVFFAPLLHLGGDTSRNEEILGHVNATESIGVRNALCNWLYPDPARRPNNLPTLVKATYVLLGVTLTFLTLWPGTRARCINHPFAALILLMAIFSPICHSHYMTFCVPLVMSLLASQWHMQTTVRLSRMLMGALGLFFMTMAIAYLPGMEILKDRCATLFTVLLLWGLAVAQLWFGAAAPVADPVHQSRFAA